MAWTETARHRYCRGELSCTSNLTDAEWALIEPFMPAPSRRGRPRSVSLRVIVEAILYMLATGCQWRQIPKEFAAFTTVQVYFYRFCRDGTLTPVNPHFSVRPDGA
jgi:transposase